jgi:hypothetical protein
VKKILLILFFPSILFSQQAYSDFFKAVINYKNNIADYVDPQELARSQRLGITYTEVKNKCLISFDINDDVKQQIRWQKAEYSYVVPSGEGEYKAVEFSMRASKYKQMFYFRDGKFIAPSTYYTKDWQEKTSKYFVFKISEPKYFNDYCIKRLDDFVDALADSLGFTGGERALLKKEKLYYIFCKDEDEVQKITGYKSKGQSVLAFDEVITAYQTHFHEVAHLLINYKLKKLGLYTHPFFMEGFAVAMGGRGGMAPRVVTDLGYYLQKTAFLTYDSILTYNEFMNTDANMTYSVAGLYNLFLLHELGVTKYFDLYRKQNGGIEFVKNLKIEKSTLPSSDKFFQFLRDYENDSVFYSEESGMSTIIPFSPGQGGIFMLKDKSIEFFINDKLLFGPEADKLNNNLYESRKWNVLFPGEGNSGKVEYCVKADSSSVEIFNFYNDEVVLSYNRNFSVESRSVTCVDGVFVFSARKSQIDIEFDKETVFIRTWVR